MDRIETFLTQYLRQWNEPAAAGRRAIVENLWRADAFTAHRLQTWRGHAEICARVDCARAQWVASPNGYRFDASPSALSTRGNLVKLPRRMVSGDATSIVSSGCNYVMLDADARIVWEYQFGLPAPALDEGGKARLSDYLEIWNIADQARCARHVERIWADDAVISGDGFELCGPAAVAREATLMQEQYGRKGIEFTVAGDVASYNGVMHLDWGTRDSAGNKGGLRGSAFLMWNADGRLWRGLQFN